MDSFHVIFLASSPKVREKFATPILTARRARSGLLWMSCAWIFPGAAIHIAGRRALGDLPLSARDSASLKATHNTRDFEWHSACSRRVAAGKANRAAKEANV
jgi:hypothetical protein